MTSAQAALTAAVTKCPTRSIVRARAQNLHCRLGSSQAFHTGRKLTAATRATARTTSKQSLQVHCGKVEKLTAEQLEVAIAERDRPLIIDFFATWCGPCVLLAAELEKVYEELGDAVRIVKVDTDENPELSTQLQIQGLPTMVFVGLDPNKPALRTEGLLPAKTIIDIVQEELQSPQASEAVSS